MRITKDSGAKCRIYLSLNSSSVPGSGWTTKWIDAIFLCEVTRWFTDHISKCKRRIIRNVLVFLRKETQRTTGECDCIGSGISKRRANVCTYTHGRHALWLPNDAFNSTWPHILDLLTQLKYVRLDTLITFPIYYKLFQNNTWSSEENDISYCTMAVGLIIAGLWLNSKQDWPVRCCRCHSHIHAKLKAFHTWLTAQWPRLLT